MTTQQVFVLAVAVELLSRSRALNGVDAGAVVGYAACDAHRLPPGDLVAAGIGARSYVAWKALGGPVPPWMEGPLPGREEHRFGCYEACPCDPAVAHPVDDPTE
jgi:hypothetical protein